MHVFDIGCQIEYWYELMPNDLIFVHSNYRDDPDEDLCVTRLVISNDELSFSKTKKLVFLISREETTFFDYNFDYYSLSKISTWANSIAINANFLKVEILRNNKQIFLYEHYGYIHEMV
jgi:hypothetical protein